VVRYTENKAVSAVGQRKEGETSEANKQTNKQTPRKEADRRLEQSNKQTTIYELTMMMFSLLE